MRNSKIERWVLEILDKVAAKQPVEDSRVELKSQWPDDCYKAARRIAGHANAARGEEVIWLIGVDEKQGIIGANYSEFTNWISSIESYFESFMPNYYDLNHRTNLGQAVVAIVFETSRAPFLIKNPLFGKVKDNPIAFDVPWREGTKVRTATRNELLKILSPLQKNPTIEMLDAVIEDQILFTQERVVVTKALKLILYFAPQDENRVTIPFHKCDSNLILVSFQGQESRQSVSRIEIKSSSPGVKHSATELIINEPGQANLYAYPLDDPTIEASEHIHFTINITPINSDRYMTLVGTLTRNGSTPNGFYLSQKSDN